MTKFPTKVADQYSHKLHPESKVGDNELAGIIDILELRARKYNVVQLFHQ
jgi:hypothetical protein